MTDNAEASAYIERLGNDFGFFLQELWQDRGLHRGHPLTVVEFDIADYAANGPKTRGILAPRGLMKTHLIVALSCFRFFRDANRKIIVPSKAHPHAKKVISMIRRWIGNVWFLQRLTPRMDQDDNKTQFQLGPAKDSLQPSMSAFGIDGMLEGNRGHSIFPDDIETAKNTETLDARTALDERVKEFKDILYPDIPFEDGGAVDPSEIVYFGTYHNEESLYPKLEKRGYQFRTWTILAPHPEDKILNLAPIIQQMIDRGDLRPSSAKMAFDGSPVFPRRFSQQNIIEKKAEGFHRFAMQHMLICDLGVSNKYPLRLNDLMVMDINRDRAPLSVGYGSHDHNGSTALDIPCRGFGSDRLHRPAMIDPVTGPFMGTIAWIDPAGRGEDLTGISIVSQLNAYLWVKCCEGITGGAEIASMEALARLCRQHGAKLVLIESNIDIFDTFYNLFCVTVAQFFLEPGDDPAFPDGWRCNVEKRSTTGQKEIRIISAIEPVASAHRLIVAPSVVALKPGEEQKDDFQYQFTRITRQRKCLAEDAKLDTLAGAISEFQPQLESDPLKARQRSVDRIVEDQTKQLQRLRGREVRDPAWFNHH